MGKDPQSQLDKSVTDVFEALDNLNPDAMFLNKNTLSNVSEYIDTGCMVLNAIVSGSLHGGVPKGRITGFSGPSMSGKTYVINKILAHAQKKGMYPVIFDSEVAVDHSSATNVGLDTSKVKYVPVTTIEETRTQIFAMLEKIEKNPDLRGKFIISIDSLGNLSTAKEINDVAEGKSAMDMGLRAKMLKAMLRVLTTKAAKTNTTILFSNHTYDDPGAMHPTLVKIQAGGKGPIYMASVLVQLASRSERQDNNNEADEMLPEAKNYSGVTLRALTVKNRFIPQFLECEMYLNFKTGLDRLSGLKDMAVNHGVLISTGSTFTPREGEKIGYYKNWKKDKKIWEYILPRLEEQLKLKYKYGPAEIADIEAELEDDLVAEDAE